MGSLTLPTGGLVYVDTACIIYSVERHQDYWPLLVPLWSAGKAGQIEIISSELTVMETLVGPLKTQNPIVTAAHEQALTAGDLRLLPLTLSVLREAAHPEPSPASKHPMPCMPRQP